MAAIGPKRSQAAMKLEARVIQAQVGESLDCPECGGSLDLEQPDPHDPDRLLGVCCGRCRSLYLLDVCPGGHEMVLVQLPPRERVLQAAAATTASATVARSRVAHVSTKAHPALGA